jgi:hypothetical protein
LLHDGSVAVPDVGGGSREGRDLTAER